MLVREDADDMLKHYQISLRASKQSEGAIRWQTVTPAALPEFARRRRIDPAHRNQQQKASDERRQEQARAVTCVRQALRHAKIYTPVTSIVVQREPFLRKGLRVERFANERFDKHRLWHVEVTFTAPVRGPLVLGDGRFTGLGLLAPARPHDEA